MNLPVVAPIASLSRRLALWWTMALLTAAAGLVVMWGWVGQRALHSEHEAAALRMATLFEASLRNAMLARDLPGLQRLIDTLGGMPGLKAAALLSPAGQVRFASAPSRVGHDEPAVLAGQCVAASCAEVSPPSLQWTHDQAGQALTGERAPGHAPCRQGHDRQHRGPRPGECSDVPVRLAGVLQQHRHQEAEPRRLTQDIEQIAQLEQPDPARQRKAPARSRPTTA